MFDCDKHCLCRPGAPMLYLSHNSSFNGLFIYTPLHSGTKHLAGSGLNSQPLAKSGGVDLGVKPALILGVITSCVTLFEKS